MSHFFPSFLNPLRLRPLPKQEVIIQPALWPWHIGSCSNFAGRGISWAVQFTYRWGLHMRREILMLQLVLHCSPNHPRVLNQEVSGCFCSKMVRLPVVLAVAMSVCDIWGRLQGAGPFPAINSWCYLYLNSLMLPVPTAVRFFYSMLLITAPWYPYFSYNFFCAKPFHLLAFTIILPSVLLLKFLRTQANSISFYEFNENRIRHKRVKSGVNGSMPGNYYCLQQLLLWFLLMLRDSLL